MNEDIKIFLKYIFDFKSFLGIIKDGFKQSFEARNLSNLFLLSTLAMFILIEFNKLKSDIINWILVVVCFILFLYFKYLLVYRGGEHRKWYRERLGIPPKKLALREEFDLKAGTGEMDETN